VDASIDNAHLADDAVGVAELSATGTASSSTFLRGDNAWASAGVSAKVGAFSRDQGASSADVAYTGVGFSPKVVLFHSVYNTADQASWGFDDGTLGNSLYTYDYQSADSWGRATSSSINPKSSALNYQHGSIDSLDADGFTIAWIKQGTPSSVSLVIQYLAIG